MTEMEMYKVVQTRRGCLMQRAMCNRQCKECKLYVSSSQLISAIDGISEIFKARHPELYFAEQVNRLTGGDNSV